MTTDVPTDLITLHDKYVLYNPATDLYLRLTQEVTPDVKNTYLIDWTTFRKSNMIKDRYVSRIQRTLRNAMRTPRNAKKDDRLYGTDDWDADIALCNNILDMIDHGIIGSVSELLLVPLMCNRITGVGGCNFLLAEPLLKVKV